MCNKQETKYKIFVSYSSIIYTGMIVIYQGELPMDTSEPADGQSGSQAGSNSSEGNTAAHSRYSTVCQ